MKEIKAIWRIAGYFPIRFVLITIVGCIVNIMALLIGIIYGSLINMVANKMSIKLVMVYCVLSLVFVIIYCMLRWSNHLSVDKYVNKLTYTFQKLYIHGLLNSSYSSIMQFESSKYLNDLTSDIEKVTSTITYNFYRAITNIVTVIGAFISVLLINWQILLVMMGFVVIMGVLPILIKKKLDFSILNVSHKKREYLSVLKEYILGVATVKNYNAECDAEFKINNMSNKLQKSKNKNSKIDSAAGGLGVLIREIAIVSLITLTCYLVYLEVVAVGSVLTVFTVSNAFFSGLLSVSAVVTYLFSASSIRDRLFYVIDSTAICETNKIVLKNAIIIKDLCFSYQNAPDKVVLDNLSLDFKKNCKYLILGKSGSGKSTLLKLLTAELLNYSGSIFIDGKPYTEFSEKDISNCISISRQQCFMFNRSLRENIDFLGTGDDLLLMQVIDLCELTNFVNRLPNGLDTIIDEEINQVSGGEKLRISLARALYRDSQILLLDEVTSALDKKTSEAIEKNILGIHDKTIINVSHKFNDNTLKFYDKIIIIEKGKVVVQGNIEDLKSNKLLLSYRNITCNNP